MNLPLSDPQLELEAGASEVRLPPCSAWQRGHAAQTGSDSESELPGPTYTHWQVLRTLGVKTFQLQKGSSHGRAKILSKHECGFETTPCGTHAVSYFGSPAEEKTQRQFAH
jgi:hypothetical protein